MTFPNAAPIALPALRGIMGNRAYYSCLMSLPEISARVNYAKEVHTNARLSDMIQRALEDKRSKEIAAYLQDNSERFFNSLVVAVLMANPIGTHFRTYRADMILRTSWS